MLDAHQMQAQRFFNSYPVELARSPGNMWHVWSLEMQAEQQSCGYQVSSEAGCCSRLSDVQLRCEHDLTGVQSVVDEVIVVLLFDWP